MLAILHEDAHLLVVCKPAGLATQAPPGGEPALEAEVRGHLRPGDPASAYVGTVHRLDRPVSGVIVWAKTPKAARRLADQFSRREARKEYWAVVEGCPKAGVGTWDDWICVEATGTGVMRICRPGTPRARRAVTHYRADRAASLPTGCTWLRLWPETGRRHQLRVQASAHGSPILGDQTYGSIGSFPQGIALHARALTIRHPILERDMTFEALVPSVWRERGIALQV